MGWYIAIVVGIHHCAAFIYTHMNTQSLTYVRQHTHHECQRTIAKTCDLRRKKKEENEMTKKKAISTAFNEFNIFFSSSLLLLLLLLLSILDVKSVLFLMENVTI